MGVLHKAVGARHPDLLDYRQCPLSRGQSCSRKLRRTGQLSGNKLPQQVMDQIQGYLGQQEMVPETKLETQQQSGPTQETESKSKLETRYIIYPYVFKERNCLKHGPDVPPGSRARGKAGEKLSYSLAQGGTSTPGTGCNGPWAGCRGRSSGDRS